MRMEMKCMWSKALVSETSVGMLEGAPRSVFFKNTLVLLNHTKLSQSHIDTIESPSKNFLEQFFAS